MRKPRSRLALSASVALAMPLAVLGAGAEGCKPKPVRMDAVRDALASSDPNAQSTFTELTRGLPSCPDDAPAVALAPGQPSPLDKGCLSDIANAFGSKIGFAPAPPDQAALSTAAVLVARDGRGDLVAHADVWLGVLKGGKGVGADALRAAVSRAMVEAAPRVGKKLESDADMRGAMLAVASAIPGACPTYRLLGKGQEPYQLSTELTPEHATCVHKDLSRREGPGASYGHGLPRALEGALALWRETERALRLGAPGADASVKPALDQRMPAIEAATAKIETVKVASTIPQETLDRMGELHAMAGILLWRDAGAGDGGLDGGVPKGIPTTPPPPPLKKPVGDAAR